MRYPRRRGTTTIRSRDSIPNRNRDLNEVSASSQRTFFFSGGLKRETYSLLPLKMLPSPPGAEAILIAKGYKLCSKLRSCSSHVLYLGTLNETPVCIKVALGPQFKVYHEFHILEKLAPTGITKKPICIIDEPNLKALVQSPFDGNPTPMLSLFTPKPVLDIPKFLEFAVGIANTLRIVHGHRIIHGDVRPEAFVLCAEGVKIVDFDLAQPFGSWTTRQRELAYLSPEESGRLRLVPDYRVDLWSAGVVFFQLLTGQLPFASSSLAELLHAIISLPPPSVQSIRSDVPPVLSQIVTRLLATWPDHRYQSAYGLWSDLKKCAEQLAGGRLRDFPLGQEDWPIVWRVPEHLYGREQETARINSVFEAVKQTNRPALVLVGGYTGSGKSALVRQLRSAESSGAFFTSGKAVPDTHVADPYGILSHAFVPLVRALLSNESMRQRYRSRIEQALGTQGHVITAVIPCMKELIGEQKAQEIDISPKDAQTRFVNMLAKVISALTDRGRPLVMVLDDLQWASHQTFPVLTELLTLENCENLMLVGTFRENEVDDSHPLCSLRETVRKHLADEGVESGTKKKILFEEIHLPGLPEDAAQALVQDTLHMEKNSALALVSLIRQRTNGNPLYFTQCLKVLYDRELLWWDLNTNEWKCDLRAINANTSFSSNVAQLLVQRFAALPEPLRRTLAVAACVGAVFSVDLLAEAREISSEELEGHLRAASDATLVQRCDEHSYRFFHDLVHAAANKSLAESEKEQVHHRLGKILQRKSQHAAGGLNKDDMVTIVFHMNRGQQCLSDSERVELAEMNLQVGQAAVRSLAYDSALFFFNSALKLLEGEECWGKHRALTFRLFHERLRALSLTHSPAHTQEEFAELLAHSVAIEEKAEVYLTRQFMLSLRESWKESYMCGLELLAILGVPFPAEPDDAFLKEQVARVLKLLEAQLPEDLPFTPVTNTRSVLVMRCLGAMLVPCFWIAPMLYFCVAARLSEISLTDGMCEETAFGFVTLGIALGTDGDEKLSDIAYHLGVAAMKGANHFNNTAIKGRVYHVFGGHLSFLRNPPSDSVPLERQALQYWYQEVEQAAAFLTVESSELLFSSFPAGVVAYYMIYGSSSLIEALEETYTQYRYVSESVRVKSMTEYIKGMTYSLEFLCTELVVAPEEFYQQKEIVEFERHMVEPPSPPTMFGHYSMKVTALAVMEQSKAALNAAAIARQYIKALTTHICVPYLYCFMSVALAQCYEQSISSANLTETEQANSFADELRVCVRELERWAVAAPPLKSLLLLAKGLLYGYVIRETDLAMQSFDDAISDATAKRLALVRAVATECFAMFLMHKASCAPAKALLRQAYHMYQVELGAAAKAARMRRRFQFLESDSSFGVSSELVPSSSPSTATANSGIAKSPNKTPRTLQLDVESAVKVANALSQEINLERLLKKILHVIMQNTSAEHAYLVLEEEGALKVLMKKPAAASPHDPDFCLVPLNESPISEEVVARVRRTRETLIVENASLDDQFALDPVIRKRQVKSMLCTPLVKQGTLFGMLYLENNKFAGAFTDERMHLVSMMNMQMCISIENARMVQKLQAASAELQKKNEELKQADQMKDRFIALTSHELRTPLNGILGTASILVETPLTADQLDLVRTIELSSNALMLLVNDLLDLSKIQARKLRFDTRPFALLECADNAMNLVTANGFAKGLELALVNRCEGLPTFVSGDPMRLQQIFLNLLSNAIKFTEVGSVVMSFLEWRRLDSGTDTEDRIEVHISVQDTGIGIPKQKLSQLFIMFSQLDPSDSRRFGGSGLGLFLCDGLLRLMGGRIWAESEEGSTGATFHVRLPLTVPRMSPVRYSELSASVPFAGKRVALLVAHPASREALSRELNRRGLICLDVRSPDALAQNLPLDMVITELSLVAHVRTYLAILQLPSTRVVALTSAGQWAESALAREAGIQPLFKPVALSKFSHTLAMLFTPQISTLGLSPTASPVIDSAKPKPHILIVEDNAVNHKMLLHMLSARYRTSSAYTGKEAIDGVVRGSPDVVLMDVQMPDMDGLEATKRLRAQGYSTPVIACTASIDQSNHDECVAAGMNDFLAKPFTKQQLLACIARWTNRESNSSPPMGAPSPAMIRSSSSAHL